MGLWLHVVLRDSPNRISAKNSAWKVFLSTKVIVCSGKADMQNRTLQHKVLGCRGVCRRHVQEPHGRPLFYRDIFYKNVVRASHVMRFYAFTCACGIVGALIKPEEAIDVLFTTSVKSTVFIIQTPQLITHVGPCTASHAFPSTNTFILLD